MRKWSSHAALCTEHSQQDRCEKWIEATMVEYQLAVVNQFACCSQCVCGLWRDVSNDQNGNNTKWSLSLWRGERKNSQKKRGTLSYCCAKKKDDVVEERKKSWGIEGLLILLCCYRGECFLRVRRGVSHALRELQGLSIASLYSSPTSPCI